MVLYICLIVYTYISKNKGDDKNTIVYICFFLWATFIAFVNVNTYWIILVIPFLIINIMVNNKFLRTNVLLETIGSFSCFLYDASKSSVFADTKLMSRLLLKDFIPIADVAKYESLCDMMQRLGISEYAMAFSTIFITTLIIILILSRPAKSKNDLEEREQSIPQSLLFVRIALIALSTGLIIYAYTATTNPISYTNLNLDNEESKINLVDVDENNTITQEIKFKDERELKELILKFHNGFYSRANLSLVKIEIWNLSNNACIFNQYIGSNTIKDNELIRINLNNVKVNDSDKYEIRLTGIRGTMYYKWINNVSVYITKKVDDGVGEVKINDEAKPNSLYFQIR